MQCPRCDSVTTRVPAAYGESIERCVSCRGIYCSENALAMLEKQWFMWPDLDTRSIDVARAGDSDHPRNAEAMCCPECGQRMTSVRPPDQPHIKLDRCIDCHGLFFDAGELDDYRYKTLSEWIRKVVGFPSR